MIITADFETYYDQEYSLSKMSEVEYVLDHRFQTIMCAVKEDDGPSEIFVGHDAVAARFAKIDWTRAAFLAHNTRFDGSILAWHYGIVPKLYLDTVSMARALTHSVIGSSSLAKVSAYLGLPDKGTEVHNMIGRRLETLTPQEIENYGAYCMRDNDNCKLIFNAFMRVFPKAELRLIDSVLRMFIEPQVRLDPHALAAYLGQVRAEKAQIMGQVAHIDKSVFSSNQKFAALLQDHGVEPPRKISPTTGEETWALAKGDRAFKELCNDDEQPLAVQALLAARLNTKSTLEETRTEKLLKHALFPWPGREPGWAPVPIRYYGARTGRMSGDGGTNWLNFKRGSAIRSGIVAPPGYRIVHRDSSQIEARMLAVLAGCEKLITAFREGRDIYCEFATRIYGRKVTKADTQMRFVGKTCILGLGYQTGPEKLRHTLFIGNGGVSVQMELAETTKIVYTYRDTYGEIPRLWDSGTGLIYKMMDLASPWGKAGHSKRYQYANPFPAVEPGPNAVWLPNGMCISYPNLRRQAVLTHTGQTQPEIVYDLPYGGVAKLYGGKTTENIDQALSRIVITDIIERVRASTGYQPFLSTYDSIDYCVPEGEAKDFDKRLEHEFAIPPSWAPNLPLASEGGYGISLLKAEHGENL